MLVLQQAFQIFHRSGSALLEYSNCLPRMFDALCEARLQAGTPAPVKKLRIAYGCAALRTYLTSRSLTCYGLPLEHGGIAFLQAEMMARTMVALSD